MSPHGQSRSTLAEVLAAIKTAEVPGRRRQDLASAVRTVAKALNHSPDTIPADPRLLAIRLKSVSCVALGLSPERWNNVRSLLRAALKLVTPVMAGRDDTPLSEGWAALFAAVYAKRSDRIRLTRLVHWLSRHQILPAAVTPADLERFKTELMTEALLRDPESTWKHTVGAWNRSAKSVPGWPQLYLPQTSRKDTYVKPWSSFPASLKQDVDRWLARLAGHDFTDDGPTGPVKPSTVTTRDYQLRSFASALVLRGRDPATLTSLACCLTYENFSEGLRFYYNRSGQKSTTAIHGLATMLKGVARHWVRADTTTLDKMARAIRKLAVAQAGLTQKNRDRLRPLQDPEVAQALVRLPPAIRNHLLHSKVPLNRQMMLAQTAAAIEILLFAPIRIGNLALIDVDRHLIRVGKKLHLVIPKHEVKNNVDLEFVFADESAALIGWYINGYRKAAPGNRALFPGLRGGPKSIGSLRLQIAKTVKQFVGIGIHPHLFRHHAAQLYLEQNPGGYEVVRRMLGHSNMATTTNFYAGLETRGAAQHFSKTVLKLRNAAGEGSKP